MKQWISWIIALMMLTSLASFAAAEEPAYTLPLPGERKTFTIMAPIEPGNAEFQDMDVLKMQEERTNVHIEWLTVPSESWIERKNLALASGDLPDALLKAGLTDADAITYGGQGMLIDLKPLIDSYGVWTKNFFEARPQYLDAITLPDGTIPTMGYVEDLKGMTDCQQFWYLNKKWLAELGLNPPTTTDELFDVLMAFKTQDPNGNGIADEIPLSFMFGDKTITYRTNGLYYIFGAFGDVDNPLHIVLHDNQEMVFTADKDGYKEGVAYLHKLYENGLLDPEGFSQDGAVYNAKMRSEPEVIGSAFLWRGDSTFGAERHDNDYMLLEPVKGPKGYQNWGGFLGDSLIKGVFAITDACNDPETLFKWMDSLYEPEFAVYWNWGIGWEKNADGVLIPLDPPAGLTTPEWRSLTTINGYVPTAILNEYYDNIVVMQPSAQWRADIVNSVYRKYMPEIIYASDNSGQPYGLLPDEILRLNELNLDINGYVSETVAHWIVEGGVEEEWDAYINQLKKMNLDELVQLYQTGYNRFRGWEAYPQQ
ncbi:MAG: extracellular solute-binding protein [Oscillospiraceae bacterium]|nr:extracellular solute-binding protein [Oscillospiraceae bacterium]